MGDRNEREFLRPCEEFTPPCKEFHMADAEFLPPAPEFPENGVPNQEAADDSGRQRRLKRKMLWLTAACIVALGIVLPNALPEKTPGSQTPPQTIETTSPTTEPTQISEPTVPDTEPTETLPTAPTFPLGSGTLEVTVYNSTVDPDNNWTDRILLQERFPEAEFTELALPQAELEDGFEFLGFVLCGGNRAEGQLHDYLLQGVLTSEEAMLVAPDADGVRHIDIHAAWLSTRGGEPWMPLTLDANGGEPTMKYDATSPLASGGCVFLCAYPRPERTGYHFAGWYWTPDCSGEAVEELEASAFFREGENGIDWRTSFPVTLYARWIPEG